MNRCSPRWLICRGHIVNRCSYRDGWDKSRLAGTGHCVPVVGHPGEVFQWSTISALKSVRTQSDGIMPHGLRSHREVTINQSTYQPIK